MTESELQSNLMGVIDGLIDARDIVEGGDDDMDTDIDLAGSARDIIDCLEGVAAVKTFEDAALLTRNAGLVLRMADGTEFQLTIVKSR